MTQPLREKLARMLDELAETDARVLYRPDRAPVPADLAPFYEELHRTMLLEWLERWLRSDFEHGFPGGDVY